MYRLEISLYIYSYIQRMHLCNKSLHCHKILIQHLNKKKCI